MLVVNRFRVPAADAPQFRSDVEAVRSALAARPGHVRAHLGRSADEPELWVLATEWRNVGSYRRALTAYEVKLAGLALLDRALDEPSAYELLAPQDGLDRLDRRTDRHDSEPEPPSR